MEMRPAVCVCVAVNNAECYEIEWRLSKSLDRQRTISKKAHQRIDRRHFLNHHLLARLPSLHTSLSICYVLGRYSRHPPFLVNTCSSIEIVVILFDRIFTLLSVWEGESILMWAAHFRYRSRGLYQTSPLAWLFWMDMQISVERGVAFNGPRLLLLLFFYKDIFPIHSFFQILLILRERDFLPRLWILPAAYTVSGGVVCTMHYRVISTKRDKRQKACFFVVRVL